MRRLSVIIIGIFLVASLAGAQQTQTGSVSGVVLADAQPMPGVTVQAASDVLPRERVAMTGANGEYRFSALPPGSYVLTFTMAGMGTEKRSVPVHLQQRSTVNVTMMTAEFEGEIQVTALTPTIDIESAEVKVSISDEVIGALPVGLPGHRQVDSGCAVLGGYGPWSQCRW